MKNIKFAIVALFAALCLPSCIRFVPQGQQMAVRPYVENPQGFQQGLNRMVQQGQGGQNQRSLKPFYPGQKPSGKMVVGQKQISKTYSVKPFVNVRGEAPADVCQAVAASTANEVSLIAQNSVKPGQKPIWPSKSSVEQIAGNNFARLGYSLHLGHEGESGCYILVEYRTGM